MYINEQGPLEFGTTASHAMAWHGVAWCGMAWMAMLHQQTLRLAAEKQASESESKIAVLLAEKQDLIDRLDLARKHCQHLLTEMEHSASAAEDRAVTAETALSSWETDLRLAGVMPAAD